MAKRSVGPVTGAATAAAALTTVIFWIIESIWAVEIPGEIQGAFTTLIVVVAGYLVPPKDVVSFELQPELGPLPDNLDEDTGAELD